MASQKCCPPGIATSWVVGGGDNGSSVKLGIIYLIYSYKCLDHTRHQTARCTMQMQWRADLLKHAPPLPICVRLYHAEFGRCVNVAKPTRSSAEADNRLDAFSGQSRSTNMVPFHMLHIVSYCAIVTLSLRSFYDIRLQKIS